MSNNITAVNNSNFETEVLKSELPVLVDFWADWCNPCKKLAPVIEEISTEYLGKVKVCKGDMNEANEVMSKLGISSLPAILIFRNGEVVSKKIGLRKKEDIIGDLETALK